jgi:hypothetical protein
LDSPLQNALILHSHDPSSLAPICRMITSPEHPSGTERLDLRGKTAIVKKSSLWTKPSRRSETSVLWECSQKGLWRKGNLAKV